MLPALLTTGRMAMQALPYITAGYGALAGAREGGALGALAGGGLGFVGGRLGVGPIRGLTKQGIAAAPGIGSVLGIKGTPLAAKAVAAGAIPVAGGLIAAPLIGGLAGKAGPALVGGVGNIASTATSAGAAAGVPGLGANQPPGVYPFDNALPPGLDPRFGAGQVFGTYADAANPFSELGAARLASEKEMDASIRNLQKVLAAQAPYSEGAKKADLTRNLYAMTVRNNQTAQLQNLLGGLQTARQMGQTAASQAGQALANQYQYV